MARKYFGTDGMRGRVGVEPMTAATVMKLGWAAGKVLAREGNKDVLIGVYSDQCQRLLLLI